MGYKLLFSIRTTETFVFKKKGGALQQKRQLTQELVHKYGL
jgi:hypothetical protein